MKSMTGYGKAAWEDGNTRIEAEVRCLNGRSLTISFKIPPDIAPYETEIKKLVNKYISRGSVMLSVDYQNETLSPMIINEDLLRRYYIQLVKLSQDLATSIPNLDRLLLLPNVIKPATTEISQDTWEKIRAVIEQALKNNEQMQLDEGKNLKREILLYYAQLEQAVGALEKQIPTISSKYEARLKNRLQELAGREYFQYTREDILREVAIFTEHADISEEIARLRSHLKQFLQIVEQPSLGKKLEFLLQEISRESNTVACKSNDADCSQIIVDLKSNVEKIREQIQNVE